MKRFMILAAAAMLSTAIAQTATVEIAQEQRTKIKQYVTTAEGCASEAQGSGDGRRDASR